MFVDYFEQIAFSNWNPKRTLWLRYVGDIFCVWDEQNNK